MRLGYIFVGTNKDPPLPHLISNMRSYNIFYCLLYLMVTFLFDISPKRKLLIISSKEGREFAEDRRQVVQLAGRNVKW